MKTRPYLVAAFVVTLMCAVSVFAATAPRTVNFTPPTTFAPVAGGVAEPLPAGFLTGYNLYCEWQATGASSWGPCQGFSQGTTTGASTSITGTLTYNATVGGRACFRVVALGGGEQSDVSNETCTTFAPVRYRPGAPVITSVTVTITAFP